MKIKTAFLLLALIGCAVMYSCKKDTNHNDNTVYNGSKVTFQKKWDISSTTSARPAFNNNNANNYAHRPIADDTSYVAIEFMLDSTYVIFYSDGNLQAGQYLATNDTSLVLDSLGTITIKSLTANSFNFTLTPDSSSSSVAFSAVASVPVSSFSSAADSAFISNVWQLDSIVSLRGTGILPFGPTKEIDFVNSPYGTYVVRYINIDGTETYEINAWLWTDDTHQSQCFGKWNGSPLLNCTGETVDTLIFSQQYTHLEFLQGGLDEYDHKK